jgi:hypothetical protein
MEQQYNEKEYRQYLISRILDQPASICHEWFQDFTVRGEGKGIVEWNEKMLSDVGIPINRLRDLCVILENKAELMGLTPQVIKTW